MKKISKILIGLFVVICLVTFSIKPIEVREYNLGKGYAKIGVPLLSPDFLSTVEVEVPDRREVCPTDSYKITIDGVSQTFNLDDNKWWNIISLGIADLNNDCEEEIMICRINSEISPSYRTWSVYHFNKETKELEYLRDIFDGKMVYIKPLGYLKVTHQLHETAYPMYETNYYTIR